MTSTAREIRSHGCPVVLSGPFTQQIHDAHRWRAWAADLGGGTVRLVWVRSDAATLRHRLAARGSGRDGAKLADFAGFTASMRLDAGPAVPYSAIDNRLTAAATLEDQVTALLAGGLERPRQALLEPGCGEQLGIGGVAHVAALDQDLRLGGQVEAGEIVPGDEAVMAVIVALRHAGVLQQRRAHVVAQALGGRDDAVVRPVRDRLQDGEPAAPGRPAVGVDVQRDGGAGAVEYVGPARDARPDAGIAVPRHHHLRAGPAQVGPQVTGNVPIEGGLGVPAVGLGAGGVAGLVLPAVPDDAVDKCRVGGVATVVAGVDPNGLARQRGG